MIGEKDAGTGMRLTVSSFVGFVVFAVSIVSIVSIQGARAADPAPAGRLSFDQAIERIIERSTRVSAQSATLSSVRAGNLPTRLFFLPTIGIDASVKRYHETVYTSDYSQRQVEGIAKLNLFRFGADITTFQAAIFEEDRQVSLLEDSVLKAEDDAVRALVSWIQRNRELEVYRQEEALRLESLKIARERYSRGLLPLQEVEKVSVDADNTAGKIAEALNSVAESEAALRSLLGDADVDLEWPWKSQFSAGGAWERAQNTELKLELRPDWRAATSRIEAEEKRSSTYFRQILPSLDSSLAYGYYNAGTSNAGASWTGTLSVRWELFDRLTNLSNARSQSYLAKVAEADRVEVERSARSQFSAARDILLVSVRSAVQREKTLETSRKLYQDSFRRFQAGRADSNALLLDQSRLFSSESLAISGWATAHLAWARFCHEQGKRIGSCS